MGEETRADGEHAHERSFTLFDPVAGMRVMADIQAEGLRAAGALLERMLGSEPDANGDRRAPADDDYAALVDAWTELTRRIIAGLAEAGQPDAVTVSWRPAASPGCAWHETPQIPTPCQPRSGFTTERPPTWARWSCAAESCATRKARS